MCETHTHGPNTVATAPHLIGAHQYLDTQVPRLSANNSQSILQSVLALQPFTDAQRTMYNSFRSKPEKMIFLANHMTKYYTDAASAAYAHGNATQGDALMSEMKKCMAQIYNGVL